MSIAVKIVRAEKVEHGMAVGCRLSAIGGQRSVTAASLVLATLLGGIASAAGPTAPNATKPTWPQVQQIVRDQFATERNYKANDIISRNQVEPILKKLAAAGWTVPQQEQLLARIPADTSWLVTNLRTDKGRRFMRQISGLPQGYDRVDRLSMLSDGKQTVAALIKGPGGQQMIEYMTTSRYGKNMSRELRSTPGGANFDQPTGMLYTADALLGELSRLYQGAGKTTGAGR
ncbi:MAG: hypothetical protein K8T25_17215 [Planctomycetia bacterium]|nr:hypothetical protein [Planctomycetia bacterium]